MRFTDEDISRDREDRACSPAAENWITAVLIERRNRIGRAFLARVLPLDGFRVTGDGLQFDDLGVVHNLSAPRTYTIDWFGFDNDKDSLVGKIGTGAALPPAAKDLPAGAYVAARVYAGAADLNVTVFLRRRADGFDVVGLDRAWPGKVIARPAPPTRVTRRVFGDLSPEQQALLKTYVDKYNQARGSQYTSRRASLVSPSPNRAPSTPSRMRCRTPG